MYVDGHVKTMLTSLRPAQRRLIKKYFDRKDDKLRVIRKQNIQYQLLILEYVSYEWVLFNTWTYTFKGVALL